MSRCHAVARQNLPAHVCRSGFPRVACGMRWVIFALLTTLLPEASGQAVAPLPMLDAKTRPVQITSPDLAGFPSLPEDRRSLIEKALAVALYLGTEKKDGRPVMINSTDGRSYRGQKANGYGVCDFRLPKAQSPSRLVGYGTPPGIKID